MTGIIKLSLREEITMAKDKHKKKKEKNNITDKNLNLQNENSSLECASTARPEVTTVSPVSSQDKNYIYLIKIIINAFNALKTLNKKIPLIKIGKCLVAVAIYVVAGIITANITLSGISHNMELTKVELSSQISAVDSDVKSLSDSLDETKTDLKDVKDDLKGVQDDLGTVTNNVSFLTGRIESYVRGQASSGFTNALSCVINGENSTKVNASAVIIGRDSNKEISAKELSGKKLLLNYEEDGLEHVFYGQLNKNNHWDGECIINSYKKGELDFMADAIYKDGKLVKYKQVFRKKETSEKIWVVSVRECDGETNHGESYEYVREKEITQDFELESVAFDNIVWPNIFISDEMQTLIGYYKGDTSGGDYNDTSGDAYLIKYNSDGTISMLYKGMFAKGQPADEEGTSWEIIWNGVNAYNYYKGTFSNGKKNGDTFTEENLSFSRIQELTADIDFNFDGLWNVNEA